MQAPDPPAPGKLGPGGFMAQMRLFERAVRLGLKTLWLHRTRSLLTVLGIVFGVCSVISMLAIGEGASYEAQQQIRSLGSTNVIVRSRKPPDTGNATEGRSRVNEYGITHADLQRIRTTLPTVDVLVPARIIRKDIWRYRHNVDADVKGTVHWYPEMRNHPIERGRFFTEREYEAGASVAVLGARTVERLFPTGPVIGETVRIADNYYRVVGVMAARAAAGNGGGLLGGGGGDAGGGASEGSEFEIFIPLTCAQDRFGEVLVRRQSGSFNAERVELHELTVRVADESQVVETAAIIGEILDNMHDKQDYEIVVPLALLRRAEETKRIFNIVLGAIAAISLVVGGIGIMNIMLASVTERTREIGIRRALGARKRDIVRQFLIETVLLSTTGGIIGVAIGITIPFIITWYAQMATIVTPWSAVLSFAISALVGIVFGIYPALRAANMNPVEALRHE